MIRKAHTLGRIQQLSEMETATEYCEHLKFEGVTCDYAVVIYREFCFFPKETFPS